MLYSKFPAQFLSFSPAAHAKGGARKELPISEEQTLRNDRLFMVHILLIESMTGLFAGSITQEKRLRRRRLRDASAAAGVAACAERPPVVCVRLVASKNTADSGRLNGANDPNRIHASAETGRSRASDSLLATLLPCVDGDASYSPLAGV